MAEIIKHIKEIDEVAHPDSGDPGLLQPSDWNEALRLVGGSDGQVVVRDTSDAVYGCALTNWPKIFGFISNLSGPVGTPPEGLVWVEAIGTSPSMIIALKVRVAGTTHILMSITV